MSTAGLAASFSRACERGTAWLIGRQEASGAWSIPMGHQAAAPGVSVTLLSLLSLTGHAQPGRHADAVSAGVRWMLDRQQPDGSFGDGPDGRFFREYATSFAAIVLASVGRDAYAEQLGRAVAYLLGNQCRAGIYRGGIGYGMLAPLPTRDDPNAGYVRDHAALSPTAMAAQALHLAGLPASDPAWELMVDYARSVHNSRRVNRRPDVRAVLAEHGYRPGDDGGLCNTLWPFLQASMARPGPDLAPVLSSGAAVFQGVRVYLYAGLTPESVEVSSAVDWLARHYSVSEHAGFADVMRAGQRPLGPDEPAAATRDTHLSGLYYYLHAMALALHELGVDEVVTPDGRAHRWADEIAAELVARQHPDGSWTNGNPRWREYDAMLSTAFALIAADALHPHLSHAAEAGSPLARPGGSRRRPEVEAWLAEFVRSHHGVAGSVHVRSGDDLLLVGAHNLPASVRAATAVVPNGKGMAGQALARRLPVQTCNLQTDQTGDVQPGARAVAANAAVALPVIGADGTVGAVVGIAFATARDLPPGEVTSLLSDAATVPLAIPNRAVDGGAPGPAHRYRRTVAR